MSSKLLVTRVLEAQLSSSSVAHVCLGSCAYGTGCVCGLWGTGSSVAIQGLFGQAVLRGRGSPSPSREPCFGGALGRGLGAMGGLKATVVGGLGAQALRLLCCRWAT